MVDKVKITILDEALIQQEYVEDSIVVLWAGLGFKCKDGYMTAITTSKVANALIKQGRVMRVKLLSDA